MCVSILQGDRYRKSTCFRTACACYRVAETTPAASSCAVGGHGGHVGKIIDRQKAHLDDDNDEDDDDSGLLNDAFASKR